MPLLPCAQAVLSLPACQSIVVGLLSPAQPFPTDLDLRYAGGLLLADPKAGLLRGLSLLEVRWRTRSV